MQYVLRPRFRFGRGQFRVIRQVLRMAVMRKMEQAEPRRRQQQDQSAKPSNPFVQRAIAKWRLMCGFVLQCEQENQHDAQRQHQNRPARHLDENGTGQQPDQDEVARQMRKSGAVRQGRKTGPFGGRNGGEEGSVVHAPAISGAANRTEGRYSPDGPVRRPAPCRRTADLSTDWLSRRPRRDRHSRSAGQHPPRPRRYWCRGEPRHRPTATRGRIFP